MRSIDRRLDRFCYKHPRLGISNLMMIVVIGNVLVYFLDMFGPSGITISGLFSFVPYHIIHGQVWRLITFIFVPVDTSNLFFFVLSLYFYWWIGSSLEREWGSVKFTVFYGIGVLLNIAGGLILALFTGGYVMPIETVSITYLNLSMFFAFATLFPEMRILLFFFLPVKIKWLAWFDAAIFAWGILGSLFQAFTVSPIMLVGVATPLLAILNYLLFFWSDLSGFVKTKAHKVQHQTSRQTVNFKQATKHAQQQKGYIHKCAVCGKTDADHPDETFRYCSKCNGYYCYCSEHIANHAHIE